MKNTLPWDWCVVNTTVPDKWKSRMSIHAACILADREAIPRDIHSRRYLSAQVNLPSDLSRDHILSFTPLSLRCSVKASLGLSMAYPMSFHISVYTCALSWLPKLSQPPFLLQSILLILMRALLRSNNCTLRSYASSQWPLFFLLEYMITFPLQWCV